MRTGGDNLQMSKTTKVSIFKTLLRRGKKESAAHSGSSESQQQTALSSSSSFNSSAPECEVSKLPSEFLDTWVQETTKHSLLETMDAALQGIWPYDKSSSFTEQDKGMTQRRSQSIDGLQNAMCDDQRDWNENRNAETSFITESPADSIGKKHGAFKKSSECLPEQTMTLMRPAKKPLGVSLPRSVSEVEFSYPTNRGREQTLQLQKDMKNSGSGGAERAPFRRGVTVGDITLGRRRPKTETYANEQNVADTEIVVASILKNGERREMGLPSQSQSRSVLLPGRNSSTQSSLTSGSSSSHSDSRPKGEEFQVTMRSGKISPTSANTQDSGYESGTLRSIKKAPNSLARSRPSSDEPQGSVTWTKDRSLNPSRFSVVGSIPLCFDQIAAMNATTMQQLCASYLKSLDQTAGLQSMQWEDLELENEMEPLHASSKCCFYRAHWRDTPNQPLTLMLSLKEPAGDLSGTNFLPVNSHFHASVPERLLQTKVIRNASRQASMTSPVSDQSTCKDMNSKNSNLSDKSNDGCISEAPKTPIYSKECSSDSVFCLPPSANGDNSAAKSLLIENVDANESRGSSTIQDKTSSSSASLENLQEEAISSILMAIADEDASSTESIGSEQITPPAAERMKQPGLLNVNDHLMAMAGGNEFVCNYEKYLAMAPKSCNMETPAPEEPKAACYVTVLPNYLQIESITDHVKRLEQEGRKFSEFEMDVVYILLQITCIIFALLDKQMVIDSINASDFIVVTDADQIPTVYCHTLNVRSTSGRKFSLTCEKLRMLLIQLSHISDRLNRSSLFQLVEDMIQHTNDQSDLRTISIVLQFLLWGPKEDEVRIIMLSEHRKQAFELWLQLARAKLINRLAFQNTLKLKIYMITNFLASTSGMELFKITKLLNM